VKKNKSNIKSPNNNTKIFYSFLYGTNGVRLPNMRIYVKYFRRFMKARNILERGKHWSNKICILREIMSIHSYINITPEHGYSPTRKYFSLPTASLSAMKNEKRSTLWENRTAIFEAKRFRIWEKSHPCVPKYSYSKKIPATFPTTPSNTPRSIFSSEHHAILQENSHNTPPQKALLHIPAPFHHLFR